MTFTTKIKMPTKLKSLVIITLLLATPLTSAVEFSIFGDVSANTSNKADNNSNFSLGAVDLFAAQQVNENTFAMMELVVENDGESFIIDLERLWVEHVFSDQFKLAAGRFHSPLGYWNRNLHHGAIIQDTVHRPFFLDFEDGEAGILPVHAIGVMANGFVLADSEAFKYEVIISNGPSLDTTAGLKPLQKPELDPNNISDNNGNKSIIARFTYQPEDSDWSLGLFTMQHNIAESSETGLALKGETLFKQAIYGADFYWQGEKFDLLTEVFSLQNDDQILNSVTHGNHSSFAYYIQPGYRLSDKTKIIYRYSDLSFESNDTYYQILGTNEQTHNSLTLRYDVDSYNSLKLEFAHVSSADELLNNTNEIHLQWSFLLQ
jgi:hypothetical protein